jgi:FixJ family two-component response regulator
MSLEASSALNVETAHVLIVDDESFVRNALQIYLETQGYSVSTAAGGEEALRIFAERANAVDVVLLDLVMPGMYGMEVLRRMKEAEERVEVIIATGCGSVHSAIEAMRYGAFDYITKPIVNFDEDLLKVVEAAIRARRQRLSDEKEAGANDRGAAAFNPLALARYYRALEDLAAAHFTEMPAEKLSSLVEEFVRTHLGAECLLLFGREAKGNHALLARFGDLPRNFALRPEELSALKLWEEPSPETPSWRKLFRGDGAEGREEEAAASSYVEALRIQFQIGIPPAQGAASDALVIRRPATGRGNLLPGTALLCLVMGLALRQKSGQTGA